MPDYDLSGLSPRSFEQLIQAIALKVISPQSKWSELGFPQGAISLLSEKFS